VHYETTGNAAGPGSLALDADLTSTRRGDTNEVLQSVLVLAGQSALIDIGQRSPVPFILGYGLRADGPVAQIGINYQTVSTGFYVTPQVFGENVELALNAQIQQGDPTTAVQGNAAAVTVRGRLGSWIQAGSSAQQTGTVGAGQSVGASDYQLWVKVDRAP
jgi:hypothetical protein